MRKIMLLIVIGMATACGSSNDNIDDANLEVTTETSEKVKEAQDVNAELEEIDGELDSLLNILN